MRTVHRRWLTTFTVLSALAVPAARAQQVTVGGVSYAQYGYSFSDSAHNNAFDVTRAYINVVGRFTGGVMTRITPDVYRNPDGSLGFRLKYAYVAWTPEHSALTFRFGQTQTPYIDWAESLWDYRMQGPIAVDRNGYMTSSDIGFAVDGHWSAERFNLQAGVYNGEGYGKASGDQRKDAEARVSYRLLATDDLSKVGGLRITGYAQYGAPTGGGARQRYLGTVSYRTTRLTLGAEYTLTHDTATTAGTYGGFTCAADTPCDGHVISAYGVLQIPGSRAAAIARVDVVDPNTNATGDRTVRTIAGASYQLSPNLRLLGDIDFLSYESGYTPTAAQELTRQLGYFQIQFTF